jgi:sugar phosphate isomerase/epimerase
MVESSFVLSGFGDEIAPDPEEQLAVLRRLGIRHLDLRAAWGRNVLEFSEADVASLRRSLRAHDARVSMIASPIGKSEIGRAAEYERERLETALRLAEAFETSSVRVFSFYHAGFGHADCRDDVLRRLAALAERAGQAGVTLLLENEAHLWGDTPERCRDLLETVGSPHLRLSLDTGNFAAMGIRPYDEAYPLLRPYLVHVQIKDVRARDGAIVPAGEGDGQVPELIAALRRDGYRGFLALEPHLAQAGQLGGFSGPDLFSRAAEALKRVVSGASGR